jgi:hypothetical protein
METLGQLGAFQFIPTRSGGFHLLYFSVFRLGRNIERMTEVNVNFKRPQTLDEIKGFQFRLACVCLHALSC